jgi:hypothetical protein
MIATKKWGGFDKQYYQMQDPMQNLVASGLFLLSHFISYLKPFFAEIAGIDQRYLVWADIFS